MALCFCVFQVSERPFLVNHIENPLTFPTDSSHVEAFSSHSVTYTSHTGLYSPNSPGMGIRELGGGQKDKDDILCVSFFFLYLLTGFKVFWQCRGAVSDSKIHYYMSMENIHAYFLTCITRTKLYIYGYSHKELYMLY